MTDKKKNDGIIDRTLEEQTITPHDLSPLTLPKQEGLSGFTAMLQGTGTNKLTQINTRTSLPKVDPVTKEATIESGDYKVFFEKYNELAAGLRISTYKLLDACTIALTGQNSYRGEGEMRTMVTISLDEYMELCGIPDTKPSKDKLRRRVQEDLEILYSISIEWSEKSGGNTFDYSKMRIVSSQGIRRGNIILSFSAEFAKYLTDAYIMQYPKELLKIDERNGSGYHIGRKLLLHHSIDNNRRNGTANIISVRALLDVCPDLPSYDDVMSAGRQVEQRIKKPFENALDALNFITWEYSNSKGVPLTDGQAESTGYIDFISTFIKFTVTDFPDQTARLERRSAENNSEAEKKRKRKQ